MFITFEGPDGSGKTTQVALLVAHLRKQGRDVLQLREPGDTPIGEEIRRVVLDMKHHAMDARTELLLYSASRAQLVAQRIRPQLEMGGIVVCDRYADSTMAYQGYGRGLDFSMIREITRYATGGLQPDLTLYLDIDPALGLNRRSANRAEWNRLDALALEFHERVRQGYLTLSAADPARWVTIDASADSETVQQAVTAAVAARLE